MGNSISDEPSSRLPGKKVYIHFSLIIKEAYMGIRQDPWYLVSWGQIFIKGRRYEPEGFMPLYECVVSNHHQLTWLDLNVAYRVDVNPRMGYVPFPCHSGGKVNAHIRISLRDRSQMKAAQSRNTRCSFKNTAPEEGLFPLHSAGKGRDISAGHTGDSATPSHAKNPRSLTHLRCISADIGEFNRYTGLQWPSATIPGN